MPKQKLIPGLQFHALMGPVLTAVRELGGSARPQEVYEHVADALGMTPKERLEQTPSGALRHENRMAWARFYLVRAGLLDSSKRGVWSLTSKGRECKSLSHEQAIKLVKEVKSQTQRSAKQAAAGSDSDAPDDDAPDPIPSTHRAAVLEILQSMTPSGFERFCQRLLREAGFQNVVITGRSGDGGIDGMGILRVNSLVTFKVLFQCKRYKETVSPSQVRDFRGAMSGRADKGIILTTGRFTAESQKESVRDGVDPIELVDGERLVDMLEDLEIGLHPVKAYRVDEPFFVSFNNALGEADEALKR